MNGSAVGVKLILLAPLPNLETFSLTSGKQFLHKLEIIQSKLCKYIHSDKGGGGASSYCKLKKCELSKAFLKNLSDVSDSGRGVEEGCEGRGKTLIF